MNAAMGMSYH